MSLADELVERHHEIVQRWYDRWRRSPSPHPEIGEAALKDSLPDQLLLIGLQLRDLQAAESPDRLWKVTERLDPEKRVSQEVPIEEVVQEYGFAVDEVREWIEERRIDVPFLEYSYFYRSMFELVAEAVRRYAIHQAAAVSEARGLYLASVMHQMRTPLSALGTLAESATLQPPDAAWMARMRRSVRRLSFLVEGVLRLERFGSADIPVRPRELAPARLVDEIVADHEQDAAHKQLRFEAHVDRSLRMNTDPDLLLDILGNFVHNAIKYTQSGSVVVEAEQDDTTIEFRVRDTGPGVPEQVRRALFREVLPGAAGGVGIGLRIARRAVEALGGEIGVESEPGQGAEFWTRLPVTVAPRGAQHDIIEEQ